MRTPLDRLLLGSASLCWLLACGPSSTTAAPGDTGAGDGGVRADAHVSASACDGVGVPGVPTAFPALGSACRSHFTFEYTDSVNSTTFPEDVVGASGVRPVTGGLPGGYCVGGRDDTETPVVLFFPKLDVGTYRGADGAEVTSRDITAQIHDSALVDGAAFVEIVGSTAAVVYGRFLAAACADDTNNECNTFAFGRFAALVDGGSVACDPDMNDPTRASCQELNVDRRSVQVTGHIEDTLCETVSDCPTPFTNAAQGGKSCPAPVCQRPSYGGHESTAGNGACVCL